MKIGSIINKYIGKIEEIIVASTILLISGVVIARIIFRYILKMPFWGNEDVIRIAVVWLTLLGASLAARKGIHVTMSAVINKIPFKARKNLVIFMMLICSMFTFYIAYLGWGVMMQTYNRGTVTPSIRIPLYILYMAFPLGFGLTGYHYLRAFVKNIRNPGIYFGPEEEEETNGNILDY